ncbi:hypothetical protein ASPZODRAFT_149999 [Penicilliopsis zonata CBS 506.65]|uniref:Sulfite oxidase n=1 Tax=Penicilliopsis zonata CBS 506.65 TaxID=1073090 RepID=A0A1L9SP63_9EURO|nr:hypothetical protein ASPZODRAFT_149999 [Penicilliopsis zonata CBS 506.65]OJJ49042.1 hypothetical protein ASPZODRAFT_149999 [Penicilliopsis zonata CBS 506.65]
MLTEQTETVENPLNREPPVKELIESFLTPPSISYDRNHGPIPHLSSSTHTLHVNGQVKHPLSLSMHALSTEFAQHEVTCALECAGNRRHTMRTLLKEVQGIDWGDGAVMNCSWRGPRLRDILLRAVIQHGGGRRRSERKDLHVAFSCYQERCQEDDWFGGSIPLSRCMREDADIILALKMNDDPLPIEHGYPLRIILPGIAGARWVKWLDAITVQPHESTNFYQQHDYKILPPEAVDTFSAEKFWARVPAMAEMPINSVVALPEGEVVVSSLIEVKGYAVPQGDSGPVTGVQVSMDEGKTWIEARLDESQARSKWCWVLWTAQIPVSPSHKGHRVILSRATDAGGNTQPDHSQWNLRGVAYNGYGRSKVTLI